MKLRAALTTVRGHLASAMSIAPRFIDLAVFAIGLSLVGSGVAVIHWPSALIVCGAIVLSTVFIPQLRRGGKSE